MVDGLLRIFTILGSMELSISVESVSEGLNLFHGFPHPSPPLLLKFVTAYQVSIRVTTIIKETSNIHRTQV